MSAKQQTKIVIGRFGAPFGLEGWIKVNSFTEPPEKILDYHQWFIHTKDDWQQLTIVESRLLGNKIAVKIMGCDDRSAASLYTNHDIGIHHSALPKLPPHEYYWNDLIGLEVINQDNVHLGRVDHLIETGANDVLVVKDDRTRLIPYISQVILEVDQEQRRIIVDWDPEF